MNTSPDHNSNSPLAGLDPEQLLLEGLGAGGDAATQEPRSNGSFVPPEIKELAALLPQFEIIELIGRGGMGAVYKARQTALDRLVAIKVLPPQVGRDPAFAERFSREAKALARLSHPRIVAVHDAGSVALPGTNDRLYYFVMEYVDGASLRDVIRAGKLPSAEALAIVPQICEALQFAHDEGIVHRDIKPDNILLDAKGRVKIADFGLAKLLDHTAQEVTLTGTHQVMGTLRYMAPEQMEGTKSIDHRADIYSLGVVFYELLTGEVPMGRFEPPSQRVQVDVRFDEVVLRSLAREPEKRYQSAGDIKTDVESISKSHPPRAAASSKEHAKEPVLQPRKFPIQMMARDAADILHMVAFVPVVIFIVFIVPTFLTFLIAQGAGEGHTRSIAIGAMVGLAVLLGLALILSMGSVQSVAVDSRGITVQRFVGPGKFLAWDDISRIRLMGRWEVVRHVWIWPGIPPRGSIMGVSSKNYFSLDARDGCWYVCPADPAGFVAELEEVERQTGRRLLETSDLPKGYAWDGKQPAAATAGMMVAYVVITVLLAICAGIPAAGIGMLLAWSDGPPGSSPAKVATAPPFTPGMTTYYENHTGVARSVAASNDGKYVVTVGDDGIMTIRDLKAGEVRSVGLFGDGVRDPLQIGLRSVAISNLSDYAYAAGNPHHSAIFKVHLDTGGVIRVPFNATATIQAVQPSSSEHRILCVHGDTKFQVLDPKGNVEVTTPIFPDKAFGNVRSIACSRSGLYTAITSSDMVPDGTGMKSAEPCQLSIIDIAGRTSLAWKIPDYADFSYAQLAWVDDQTVLLALPSGQLHRWRMNDAGNEWQAYEPVRIAPGSFTAACLSEDRKSIWLSTDRQLMAYDWQTGKSTAFANVQVKERAGSFAADAIESICVIRGRELIAAALWDGRVAIAKPVKIESD